MPIERLTGVQNPTPQPVNARSAMHAHQRSPQGAYLAISTRFSSLPLEEPCRPIAQTRRNPCSASAPQQPQGSGGRAAGRPGKTRLIQSDNRRAAAAGRQRWFRPLHYQRMAALDHARGCTRTVMSENPRTKFDWMRTGRPTTSILSQRSSISSHNTLNWTSARRSPMQR